MHLLHYVHEMNAYVAVHFSLRPSVRMILLKNGWMDLNEIWNGCYPTGDYPKSILFNFIQLVVPTWQVNKRVRWDRIS